MTGWLTMAQARAYLHCSTDYLLGLLAQGTVTAYARPGGKFALILVGAFFLLLPIAIHLPGSHGDLWPGLAQAVPATFYFTVNITGVAGELEEWTPVIHQVMGDGLLSLLYYIVYRFRRRSHLIDE